MRIEKDALGDMEIGEDVLWGINTQRAIGNFDLRGRNVNKNLIHGIVTVKKAAAMAYQKLGVKPEVYEAIEMACDEVLAGKHEDCFPVLALQGGAGTSTNMNVNEVLSNLALKHMGKKCGEYDIIHPLDDVNRGQSTNDVYPTGLRIAAIRLLRELSDECSKLQTALQEKENEFAEIQKLGRTELMDAVPVTLGEEFGAYAQAVARDRWRLYKVEERLRQVNIGGTAVGNSDNADRQFCYYIIENLRRLTGIGLAVAEYPMDITQNNDVFVEVSGLLKALAVNLSKIAGDLRLMNMGPKGGIGEIHLVDLQQGSTIMPGKVNPVIPELTIQVSMKIMANDTAIANAASRGEFELNAFLPLIADMILESLELLKGTVKAFRTKAVETVIADEKRCLENLEHSYAFATEYVGKLGYEEVSRIIRENSPEKARGLLTEKYRILQKTFENTGD